MSLSLLALVLAYVPLDAVVTELSNARPVWVISGIGLLFVVRLTSAYRMRIITRHQGMSVSAIDIFKIGLVTSFFGLFLPGYIAGGAIRWHMLSRTDKKGVEAIASIAFDRVNDTIVLISLGCMCLAAGTPSAASPVVPWILTGTLAVLLVLYTVLLNPRAIRFSAWVTEIIGLYQRPWFNRLFTRLADSMQQFRRFPGLVRLRLWGLSLASHLIGTMVFVFFAGAVNLELSFADCAWLRAILYLLFLFPLSVSGIGVREGALIVLLAPFGITSTQAVAYSFIMMSGLLIMVGIGGLLMPGMLGRAYKARPG